MVQLAVLDPSGIFRNALVSLLRTLGFGAVAEASTIASLERASHDGTDPELVLVSLSRRVDSIDAMMDQIRARLPEAKVVFLAPSLDVEALSACFAAGASGYLLENISCDTLEKSLTLVCAGGKVFPSELASLIPSLARWRGNLVDDTVMSRNPQLSEREVEILHCLAKGQSNKVIAASLDIAEATVKVHLKHILRKIQVGNRTQAALWAAARGLTAAGTLDAYQPGTEERKRLSSVALKSNPRHAAMRQAIPIRTAEPAPAGGRDPPMPGERRPFPVRFRT